MLSPHVNLYFFIFYFLIYQNMGKKLDSNNINNMKMEGLLSHVGDITQPTMKKGFHTRYCH
jgi:hypothetical protein